MMLILKPKGRGNWAAITIAIEGARVSPLLIRVGQMVPLGGVMWRICRVMP